MITAGDASDTHIIWATLRWAKENAPPAPAPAQPAVPLTQAWRDSAQWLRNNYQDHPNIASLCNTMVEYGSKPKATGETK
jgi:hypothetical protein